MATTRLGPSGTAWSPWGSFAGKTAAPVPTSTGFVTGLLTLRPSLLGAVLLRASQNGNLAAAALSVGPSLSGILDLYAGNRSGTPSPDDEDNMAIGYVSINTDIESDALANIDGLQVAVAANAFYRLEAMIYQQSVGDLLRVKFTAPGSAAINWFNPLTLDAYNLGDESIVADPIVDFYGIVQTGATAGNVTMQGRIGTEAPGNVATIYAGSHVILTRLDA